jgi:hypothetical protein
MRDYMIGIDNGVTGSIAVLTGNGVFVHWCPTPTFEEPNYTKKGSMIRRILRQELALVLAPYVGANLKVLVEYPLINPAAVFIHTTFSAARSLEATISTLEDLKIPFEYMYAPTWQKAMLPYGLARTQLKKASRDIAHRLYPKLVLPNGADGDAVLLAEYGRRNNL